MRLFRSVSLLLYFCIVAPAVAAAQDDARVLPAGMVRLRLLGVSELHDARYGSPGMGGDSERQPLSVPFETVLMDSTFRPVLNLQDDLNTFFDATDTLAGPFEANAANLLLNVSDLRAFAETRKIPIEIDLGVLPRVSIGVQASIVSHRLDVQRLGVTGGTVGVNPDPFYNDSILGMVEEAVGAEFELAELGGGLLLPTQGSEVGDALQARVRAATGGLELMLPESPVETVGRSGVTGADSAALTTGLYEAVPPRWEVGDTEIAARVQFLNTVRGYPFPEPGSGVGYRGAVEAGIRLPTGAAPEPDYLVLPPPEQGIGGTFAELYNDLFISPRLWLTAAARWESRRAVEYDQRVWAAEAGEFATQAIRWEPGTRLGFSISPRFRFGGSITVFGSYLYARREDETFTIGGVTIGDDAASTARAWTVGMSFNTLPSYFRGRTGLPIDASIRFRETFEGSAGVPASRAVEVRGSLYYPLWGRRDRS